MDCLFAFSWVFSCEIVVIKYRLRQPCIVHALNCVGKVLLEDFISCHNATDCWNLKFYYFIESFWAKHEDFCACVIGQS